MGELHMDIVKCRLVRDYGLNVFIGPLQTIVTKSFAIVCDFFKFQIAYREIISHPITLTRTVQDIVDDKKRIHSANLTLCLEPAPKSGKFKSVCFIRIYVQVELPPDATSIRSDWLKAINEGCGNALHNGPVLGFPIQDVVIKLKGITTSGGRVNPAVLSACAHKCVTEAIEAAGARLIEPIMRLDISLESGTEAQSTLHELSRRRADIVECCGTQCKRWF
ncbi:unnamed protein product, partial [Strongylus vulgaris]